MEMRSTEFSLNGFIEFAEFSELNICHCSKSAQTFHLGKTPIITVHNPETSWKQCVIYYHLFFLILDRMGPLLSVYLYPFFGFLVMSDLLFKDPAHNRFLRFTSGETPADLLVASMATGPFQSTYLCTSIESRIYCAASQHVTRKTLKHYYPLHTRLIKSEYLLS